MILSAIKFIVKLFEIYLYNDYDIIIGSRYLLKRKNFDYQKSEVLNMPRATVIRRLKYLEKFIFKDDNKIYHFKGDKIKELEKTQKNYLGFR